MHKCEHCGSSRPASELVRVTGVVTKRRFYVCRPDLGEGIRGDCFRARVGSVLAHQIERAL